jgi:DNA-binding protein WhiA
MSFSKKTKNELSRLTVGKSCCQLAELAALVRFGGTIQLSSGQRLSINIITENAAVARRIFSMLKKVLGVPAEIAVRRKTRLRKNNSYVVRIPPQADVAEVLSKLKILNRDRTLQLGLDSELIKNRCCRRAFLRGAFLGAGSLSDPGKTNHLELVMENKEQAEQLRELINSFGLQAKIIPRKNNWVIYL